MAIIQNDKFSLCDRQNQKNFEYAIAQLEELRQTYPDADIFLNGELTVDFPEDVKIPIEPNQMTTAVLSGNRIKFSYCGVGKAIALLREQYAVGTVEVRIISSISL